MSRPGHIPYSKGGYKVKGKSFGLLLLIAVLGLSLSGCGCFQQAVKGETAPPPQKEGVVAPPPAPAPAPVPAPPPPPPPPAAVLQPIYFDLNESVIRYDAAETLKQNLEWFRQNPDRKVMIQGNCDPRATKQYNRILGQRRAGATKKYLVGLGINAGLLQTISYGKDRPSCKEKDESCWAKERRVDFEPMP
jgi:peptidoglycan-associated lipoprotein